MSTAQPKRTPSKAELIALALDHRIRAERSTCPGERLELDRVSDIYEVPATFDLPVSTFTEVEGTVATEPAVTCCPISQEAAIRTNSNLDVADPD